MLSRTHLRLIDILLEFKYISEEAHKDIIEDQTLDGQNLEIHLLEEFNLSPEEYLIANAEVFQVPPINLIAFEVGDYCFEHLDLELCKTLKVLPVGTVGKELIIACSDPLNPGLKESLEMETKKPFTLLFALESAILSKLEKDGESQIANNAVAGFGDVVEALGMQYDINPTEVKSQDFESEESTPIVLLANRIIEDAYFAGASDIHIEPMAQDTCIRIRIDGKCRERLSIPNLIARSVVARYKVMGNMDVAERRKPQDGRIPFDLFNRKGIDLSLRVSTAPQQYGEGAVMRLIDKQKSLLPLEVLGFSEHNLTRYKKTITRPYGMILHCGPTGSGKSMTLYSALNVINSPEKNIRTAEDPVEYSLPGAIQVQMDRRIPVTFSSTLRAFLRQDPDIILVGEIRDEETASIAVEAAMTGHLLFSTLHTNDAVSTINRLTEMGIEPFLISSALLCVCSQRLIRRLCDTCKQTHQPSEIEKRVLEAAIGWSGEILQAKPKGCPNCGGVGYRKRTGVHEILINNDEVTNLVNSRASIRDLKDAAIRSGMRTLHQDGAEKVRDRITSLEECLKTVPPDEIAPPDISSNGDTK